MGREGIWHTRARQTRPPARKGDDKEACPLVDKGRGGHQKGGGGGDGDSDDWHAGRQDALLVVVLWRSPDQPPDRACGMALGDNAWRGSAALTGGRQCRAAQRRTPRCAGGSVVVVVVVGADRAGDRTVPLLPAAVLCCGLQADRERAGMLSEHAEWGLWNGGVVRWPGPGPLSSSGGAPCVVCYRKRTPCHCGVCARL